MAKYKKAFTRSSQYIHEIYNTHYEQGYVMHPMGGVITFPQEVRGLLISSTSEPHPTFFPPPKLSNMETLLNELREAINKNSAEEIKKLLQGDYVFAAIGGIYKEDGIHLDVPSEIQGHLYTKQLYWVRPNIEELLLQNPTAFKSMLHLADQCDKENNKQNESNISLSVTMLQTLCHIKLDHEEGIDFSGFDLTGASFSKANLGKSNFTKADTETVDFSGCNLSKCTISQEQLDNSNTYEKANIPSGCWPYWSEDSKEKLNQHLENLKKYVEKNIPKEDEKHQKALAIYAKYSPMLAKRNRINAQQKKTC